MEKCDHSIFPGWLIQFLYSPAHKAWLFEKSILELDASSHNELVSQEDGCAISKINCFNFMVFCLYSFYPCVGINEVGNYLSRNNIQQLCTAIIKAFPLALCRLSLWLLVSMEVSKLDPHHGYLSSVSLQLQMVYPNIWILLLKR